VPYATLQTLIDLFGEDETTRSSDRDGDGVADTDVVTRALEAADGIIDSRIGVKYKLPLIEVPAVLIPYAADIALYRMSYDTGTLTEEKRKRYEDALRWLDLVATGKAVLDGAAQPETKAGGSRYFSEAREFTRAKLGEIL
jgi:phage gp36-like protein